MNNEAKKIKRRNGEQFLKTIANYDNGILDVPGIVDIVRYAGNTKEDAEGILGHLVALKNVKIEEKENPQDPFDLLKKAGYHAFIADTAEKKNSIEHLYYGDEGICTFNDSSRHKNYYIVHCVHENAEKLNRKDFNTPRREDDYGTSVISIQISKKGGFISIKNRYNHKVKNCDNTFGSNPDNIIDGLSCALKNYFDVDFSSIEVPLPDGFIMLGKQILKIEQECDGINFGYDFYLKDGVLTEVKAGEGQYLVEIYLYDDRKKMMTRLTGKFRKDSFPDDFNRHYGGKKSLNWRKKSLFDGDTEIITCA